MWSMPLLYSSLPPAAAAAAPDIIFIIILRCDLYVNSITRCPCSIRLVLYVAARSCSNSAWLAHPHHQPAALHAALASSASLRLLAVVAVAAQPLRQQPEAETNMQQHPCHVNPTFQPHMCTGSAKTTSQQLTRTPAQRIRNIGIWLIHTTSRSLSPPSPPG